MQKENKKYLQPNRLTRVSASTGRIEFRAVVENDVTVDNIKDSDFWSLVSTNFINAGTLPRIEIIPDDVSWLIDAVILDRSKSHAVVYPINQVEFKNVEQKGDAADGLFVKYRGPANKFAVINSKGNVIREGFQRKEDADNFLREHRKVISI